MNVRPLNQADIEPLHELYGSLAALMPHQPEVGSKQFREQLLSITSDKQPQVFLAQSDIALVAEQEGQIVAFGAGALLQQDGELSSMKAGTGLLRFIFARPQHARACRAVIRALVEHGKALGCQQFRALSGYYGPPFHNNGGAMLSNAWPWIGQCLSREGFQTRGLPSLSLHRSLGGPLEALPLPSDAHLRRDWETRIGARDEWEFGYHIFIGDRRAAETMCYYGEKFVRSVGKGTVYVFWLGVNEGFRGLGLGRILLRQALVEAQQAGAREATVRTGCHNFDALAIYRAEGFVPDDVLWEFELKIDCPPLP